MALKMSRRFALSVLIAFLPAAVMGGALHKVITGDFSRTRA